MKEQRYGSDLLVDLLAGLGVEFVMANPGATTRGLHDSLVNRGPGPPALVLCTHEEIAVAAAHGYAKATGRVGVALVHDLVGLLHGSMAIFNAFIDQAPIVIIGGTGPADADRRRPWIDWIHTASVEAQAVREFVKWDVTPTSLRELRDALIRAFRVAATPPHGPVYLSVDVVLQEDDVEKVETRAVSSIESKARSLPSAPAHVVSEIARKLREAAFPVILTQRLGQSADAFGDLVRLADNVPVAIVDLGARLNFPTQHPSNASELKQEILARADFLLALDVQDLAAELDKRRSGTAPHPVGDFEVVRVSLADYALSGWSAAYQQLARNTAEVLADPAGFVGDLVSVTSATGSGRARVSDLQTHLASLLDPIRAAWHDDIASQEPDEAISPAALAYLLRDVLASESVVLVNGSLRRWALRLWDFDAPRQWLGHSGGGGLGYGPGASLGAALAYRGQGVICVNLQADGDFMYTPGALWTAANQGAPLLTVMFNNRSYYHDELHQAAVAGERGRPEDNRGAGIRLEAPDIDYAAMAMAMGVHAIGPVTVARDVSASVEAALAVVKTGRPALVDVVTRGR